MKKKTTHAAPTEPTKAARRFAADELRRRARGIRAHAQILGQPYVRDKRTLVEVEREAAQLDAVAAFLDGRAVP